jgi:hypothetical protein
MLAAIRQCPMAAVDMAVAALAEAVEALRVLSADESSGGLGLMPLGLSELNLLWVFVFQPYLPHIAFSY